METYQLPFTSETIEKKLQLIDENAEQLLTDKNLESLADKTFVTNKIAEAQLANEGIDLSEYAKKSELPTVPTKVSQLTNDKGYITAAEVPAPNLDAYAKKSEIPDVSSFATENYVATEIAKAQLGGEEVDLSGYATEQWVKDQGYLTEHQDISGKADKVHNHSEYLTEETLDTALADKSFLPSCGTANEGQFLRVVGGVATWTNIAEAEKTTF